MLDRKPHSIIVVARHSDRQNSIVADVISINTYTGHLLPVTHFIELYSTAPH